MYKYCSSYVKLLFYSVISHILTTTEHAKQIPRGLES